MAKLTKTPSHVAQLGYSGFDMSQLLKFSSTTGHLLPVYYDLLYPGDKVTMSSILKTRTMPLNSSAMVDIKEHIDWFAVPLDQIYSLFSQWYYGISDLHSSLYAKDSIIGDHLPFISYDGFNQLFNEILDDRSYANMGSEGEGLRLLELLGIPLYHYDGETYQLPFSFNPMFFCAYQKIYFDYYRLSDREENNPYAYNLDHFYDDPDILGNGLDLSYPLSMFKIRYRSWAKDFFTLGYVSPLFGVDSISAYPNNQVDLAKSFSQWLTEGANFMMPADATGSENTSIPTQVAVTNLHNQNDIYQSLSPTAIRTSFAVQKLLEITRRAGKRLDKQTLAHFGVKPSSQAAGEVEFIGGSTSHIVIGDVIATAQTDAEGGSLGRVGGKGYGYDTSKKFKYENNHPCPVILMAIYSAEPSSDYRAFGLDRLNTYLTSSDFMRPEFDNLGMQPLYWYQSEMNPFVAPGQSLWNLGILNWQFRWQESKMKYNRVCGSLARSMDTWTAYRDFLGNGISGYLVSPHALDSIMVYPYHLEPRNDNFISIYRPDEFEEGTKSSLFDADPLIHELFFNVFKSSTMSSYGLESL